MILYLSSNDGSDTRVNKELMTLSKKSKVTFVGVGGDDYKVNLLQYCTSVYLVKGKRNTIIVLLKTFCLVFYLRVTLKLSSIHVINEQLMVFFYPLLLGVPVVLDVFDSIFLKIDKPFNKLIFLKRITYFLADTVVVTDSKRKNLMPNFVKKRVVVLENYPLLRSVKREREYKSKNISIFYNGTLSINRGTLLLRRLVEKYKDVFIEMAGWIYDYDTVELSQCNKVNYRGVLSQQESAKVTEETADFIMCCYAPNNLNNIHASPNKLYDAIQTNTPVIINKEIEISSFVEKNELGVVISSFDVVDELYSKVKNYKKMRDVSVKEKRKYSWEGVEQKLLKAHNVKFK
ncbi:hypothetical protein OAH12_00020 [Cyclobacteriaceae bacterium]|nr:hypothetical protein [Cyclobacteriaceae bacterium]